MTAFAGLLLSGLVGPGLFLAAGLGLARLSAAAWSRGWMGRLGFAYLLGTAFCGSAGYLASSALDGLLTAVVVASALLAATAPWLLGAREPADGDRQAPPGRSGRAARAAAVSLAAAVSGAVLLAAVAQPATEWDGIMTWGPLTKWVRAEQSASPRVLREPAWFVSHPRYPVLMPVLGAASQDLSGGEDERASRALYALFLPAFLAVLWSEARRRSGLLPAAAVTAMAALTPALTLDAEGGAAGIYADFPLASFAGTGALLLVRSGPPDLATGALAGLLLGAAALTKAEGTVLAVAGLVGAVLHHGLRRRGSGRLRADLAAGTLPAAGVVGVVLVLLQLWRNAIPSRFEDTYLDWLRSGVSPAESLRRLGRGLQVALGKVTSVREWGLTWLVVPPVVVLALRLMRPRRWLPLLVPVVAPIGVALAAFSLSLTPEGLANATTNRLLLQGALPGLVVLAAALQRWRALGRGLRRKSIRAEDGVDPPFTAPSHDPRTIARETLP